MRLKITFAPKIFSAFCATDCACHCSQYTTICCSPEPNTSLSHSNSGLRKIQFSIIFSLIPGTLQRQSFSLKLCINCTCLPMLLISYSSSLHSVVYDERKLRRTPFCAVSAYFLLGLEPNEYKPL
jgi:hypothetical protein